MLSRIDVSGERPETMVDWSRTESRTMRCVPSEIGMHEHRIQHGVKQSADQESHDRPVHTNILQVAADSKLQPVDDSLGIPVGDDLTDELGDSNLRAGQQ